MSTKNKLRIVRTSSTINLSPFSRPPRFSPRARIVSNSSNSNNNSSSRDALNRDPGLLVSNQTSPTRVKAALGRSTYTRQPRRRKLEDSIPKQILPSL